MAKVYRVPEGFEPPQIDFKNFDYKAHEAAENAYIERLAAEARRCNPGNDLAGETVKFPAADGYAIYMVWGAKPLSLVHLELGDAWQIPAAHARGLTLTDIKENVRREKALRELFSKHAAAKAAPAAPAA